MDDVFSYGQGKDGKGGIYVPYHNNGYADGTVRKGCRLPGKADTGTQTDQRRVRHGLVRPGSGPGKAGITDSGKRDRDRRNP